MEIPWAMKFWTFVIGSGFPVTVFYCVGLDKIIDDIRSRDVNFT